MDDKLNEIDLREAQVQDILDELYYKIEILIEKRNIKRLGNSQ
jgi:hypothetical protein